MEEDHVVAGFLSVAPISDVEGHREAYPRIAIVG